MRPAAVALTCLLGAALGGCAGRLPPLVQKETSDVRSTGLFQRRCAEPAEAGDTLVAAAAPASVVDGQGPAPEPAPAPPAGRPRAACDVSHLASMVERFMSIEEMDEARGVPGDTVEDVRRKGFTIFLDARGLVRRPNTRALYGAEALAAVGMGVSPPALQKPEEIKAYTEFMASHYGEEYVERDLTRIEDRFCLNTRNALDRGDDRVFAIVWRGGRVLRRVIKGGPVHNPRREHAFLLCPGSFLADVLTGGARRATGELVSP